MKRSLKITGIVILGSLAAIIVILYILVTSRIGEDFIRGQAETRIGGALGTPIIIGSLETNLLSRLVLEDLRVYPDSTAEQPWVTLARGAVRYRLIDLIRARLTLSEIQLDSLMVDVVRDSTGIQGIPAQTADETETEEETEGGFPLEISLGRLEIIDSEAHYSDRVISLDSVLRDLDASVLGDGGGYDFNLDAGPGSVEFRGNPVDIESLALDGSWRDGVLDAQEIRLDITGLSITALATLDTGESPPALEGRISASGDPSQAAAMFAEYIPGRALPQGGNLRLEAVFTDLLDSTRTATVSLDIDSLRTTDALLRSATIRGEYRNSMLVVEQLQGAVFGGEIEGKGEIVLTGEYEHDVSLSLIDIELNDILQVATGSEQPYSGTINGSINSQGPVDLQLLRANADLTIDDLARDGQSIDAFEAVLSYNRGVLDADITQGNTTVHAEASIDERRLSGELEAEIDRLRPIVLLFGLNELDASGEVQGTLSGTLDQPEFEVRVDARDAFYRGLPVESLSGRLAYREGRFSVEESEFSGEAASVDSLISAWNLPAAIHGGIEYSGEFNGWADDPHLELSAELTAPSWNDIVFDSGDIELTLDVRTLVLNRATLSRNDRSVSASMVFAIDESRMAARFAFDDDAPPAPDLTPVDSLGTTPGFMEAAIIRDGVIDVVFGFGGDRMSLRGSGGGIDISDAYRMYSGGDSVAVGGELSFRAEFAGGMDQPDGALRLGITGPRYDAITADSLSLAAHVTPEAAVLDTFALHFGDFLTTASGEAGFVPGESGGITIGAGSPIQGMMRGRMFRLSLVNPFLPEGMSVEGDSMFDIAWDGSIAAPQVNGDIRLENARLFRGGENPVIDSLTVDLAFQDSLLRIATFDGLLQKTPFSLAGNISITDARRYGADIALSLSGREAVIGSGAIDGENIDFTFRSESFDLALVRPFVPQIDNLSGRLQSDVVITGTLSSPSIEGRIQADSLGFSPPVIDERIAGGVIDLQFSGSTVSVDSLRLPIGGGVITANGSLEYADGGIAGLDVSTVVSGVKLDREDVFSLNIDSAKLGFRRSNGGYLLSGDVALGESRFEYDISPQFVISYIRQERGRPQEPAEILRQTRMEIRLRGGDQLWVDNNLANVRFHPELEFVGTLASPNVTGRLTIEEGYILYLDRQFEVTQGVVDFVSRTELRPIIEFHAMANISGSQTFGGDAYAVTFEVTGPIDEAEVRLTSEPQLSRADIISLLTFGATGDQLTGGGGEDSATVRSILADRITRLGSEQLSMYVSRELGDLLGIDKLSIQGDLFAFGDSWGPQLVASEQINERLEITYTTNVGQLNQQGIRLDYQLSRLFSVEGHTNQAGKSGIDFKYSLKFR